MARLFPLRSDTPSKEGQPRVVDLEDEDADAVFGALSSSTAREIYSTLDDEPGTPSDTAEAVDSSIQNVRYHLEKLEDAGLVEVVDTWYSSRGNEMSVYATADGPLIVTSDESTATKLRTALSRFLGGVGALAAGSLLVQYGLQQYFSPTGMQDDAAPAGGYDVDDAGGDAEAGDDAATDDTDSPSDDGSRADEDSTADDVGTAQHDESGDQEAADDPGDGSEDLETTAADENGDSADTYGGEGTDDADTYGGDGAENADDGGTFADGIVDAITDVIDGIPDTADAMFSSVSPGLLFFLGGLSVLIVVTVYWYRTSQ